MDITRFGSTDMNNVLASMTDKDLNELAFGAVQLDANGTILKYNAAEAGITGRKVENVLGKNFFSDIAPCTKRPEFYGKFQAGVAGGKLNELFEYVFDYQMKPTKVKVHMMKALTDDSYWVFVKRL
ncbi:MAG TPA: photoactive yellow protein [Spirochaetia bacterium]|nr:photoactive yellow protein [Spirochaetia bacterium]